MRCIFSAMEYMHCNNIVHRDLKPGKKKDFFFNLPLFRQHFNRRRIWCLNRQSSRFRPLRQIWTILLQVARTERRHPRIHGTWITRQQKDLFKECRRLRRWHYHAHASNGRRTPLIRPHPLQRWDLQEQATRDLRICLPQWPILPCKESVPPPNPFQPHIEVHGRLSAEASMDHANK